MEVLSILRPSQVGQLDEWHLHFNPRSFPISPWSHVFLTGFEPRLRASVGAFEWPRATVPEKYCWCDRQGVTESGCWEYGFPYRRWTVFHFSFPAKLSPRAKVCRAPPVPKSVGTECGDMATSIGLSGRDKRPTILQEAARSFLRSHTRHLVKMYGLAS